MGSYRKNYKSQFIQLNGKVNAATYVEMFKDNDIFDDIRNKQKENGIYHWNTVIFQQDNARPHTAKTTKEYLKDSGVRIIIRPANSPDLSPIEDLLTIMKHLIERNKK